jgi:hypothetical protein
MTKTSTDRTFTGPYKSLLNELSALIDWLWAEHDKSFVKAGDDKVYAFGGDGYIVVFDESLWEGLIELITPTNGFTLKPGEDGAVTVTSSNADEKASKEIFKEAIAKIRAYYESRYWSTPKTKQQ